MALTVPKSVADALGFDLTAAVAAHLSALAKHAKTVNKPAPSAHAIVEEIVRGGGAFEIVDDAPVPTAQDVRAELFAAVNAEANRRIGEFTTPARIRLAQMEGTLLGGKPPLPEGGEPAPGVSYRTAEEHARFLEIQALFERISDIQRRALAIQIDLEDLPDGELPGWTMQWGA